MNYRADIDGLRTLAITLVVLYHYFPEVLGVGFIGVDIFFVISGFLITKIIINKLNADTFSFKEFYTRRVNRIFPALIITLSLIVGVSLFLFKNDEYQYLLKHINSGIFFVSNITLWRESGYFDTNSGFKVLLNLWSLAVEEQFYIVYPLVLWLVSRTKLNIKFFLVVTILISVGINTFYYLREGSAGFYLLHARMWEMLCGGYLAQYDFNKIKFRKIAKEAFYLSGLLFIVATLFLLDKKLYYPNGFTLLVVIGAMLLIAFGQSSIFSKLLFQNKLVVLVGLISYPLYLIHWPVLVIFRILNSRLELPKEILIILILFSILLSYLIYKYIEVPLKSKNQVNVFKSILVSLFAFLITVNFASFYKDSFESVNIKNYEKIANSMKDELALDKNCQNIFHNNFNICKFNGPVDQVEFVIVGDSHAANIFNGFVRNFPTRKFAVLGQSGCPMLLGVEGHLKASGSTVGCLEPSEKIYNHIKNTATIKAVVLINRAPLYIEGSGYFSRAGTDEEKNHDYILSLSDANFVIADNKSVYEKSLSKTIEFLTGIGKKVYVFTPIPELGFHSRECLPRRPGAFLFKEMKCEVSLEVYNTRTNQFNKLLRQISQLHDFNIFRVEKYLCNETKCKVSSNPEGILYSDDDHLSVEGASWLISKFKLNI